MMIMYIFGLPLAAFLATRKLQLRAKRKKKQTNTMKGHHTWGAFYSSFREETWWWEGTVAARKVVIALIGVFGAEMGQMQVLVTLVLVVMILLITAIVRPFSNIAQQEHLLQSLELISLMAIFLTLWAASVFSTYPKCEDPNEAGKTIVWCDFLSVVVGLVDFIILISLISCFIAVKFFGVNFGDKLINNTRVGKSLSRWTSMRSFRKTQRSNVQSSSNETKNERETKNRNAEVAAAAAEIELTSIVSETTEEEEVVEEEIVEEVIETEEQEVIETEEVEQQEEWVK